MVNQTDVKHADLFSVHVAHRNAKFLERTEQLPTLRNKLDSPRRQAEATSAAFTKSKAEASLEGREVRTKGGLAEIEGGLSGCDSACIHHGKKQADETQIEIKNVTQQSSSPGDNTSKKLIVKIERL